MTKQKNNKDDLIDYALLILIPILAGAISVFARIDFLFSTFLFFGLPALYLSLKNPSKILRTLIFSGCFTLASIFADYMAEKDFAWREPLSVLSFRIAGQVPIESVVWFFLLTYLVVIYYQHFFDRAKHKLVGRKMPILFGLLVIGTILFCLPFLFGSSPMTISYFYLKLGLFLGFIPLIAFTFEFPRFISIFLKMTPYFISLSLLNEIVGLHNNYWQFPGTHYIGWVEFGSYRFPLEELLFWMVMFCSIVVAYFEFFDDNHLKLRFGLRR